MKGTGRSRQSDELDSGSHLAPQRDAVRLGVSTVRVPELAVGLFIVAASIGGAVFWQRSVEAGTAVLVTSRDIGRGEVLSAVDLSEIVVTASADIALIRSSSAGQVVGRRVTADLRSGTPLIPAFLTTTGNVGPLDGLVGLTVRLSSAPVELAAGDLVRIFTVETTLEGEMKIDEVPGPLEIWEVSTPDPLSSERAVTVKSPLESIPRLVGREEIHLVKVVG
ncbi:MAG: hypothetical protein RLZ37_2143 [Actinomycetota bacterium]